MAIALAENFKGLGIAAGVDIKAQVPIPYGAALGVHVTVTNNETLAGKNDIVNLEVVNGKTWIASYNSGYRFIGPTMAGIGIPASNSTVTVGARFRAQVPGAAVANCPLFRIGGVQLTWNMPAQTQEFYAEMVLNRETGGLELWVDNKRVGTFGPLTGGGLTGVRASTDNLVIAVGSTAYLMHTDVVVIHDMQDDGVNSRVGAVDISAVPLQVSSNPGYDVTAMADVLARKDYAPDTGTRVKGTNGVTQAELKLVKANGYTLPNDTPVIGMCLVAKSIYTPGQPGDLRVTHKRGPSTRTVDSTQLSVMPALPNIVMGASSRSAAEQLAATALDGLEISLKVMDR